MNFRPTGSSMAPTRGEASSRTVTGPAFGCSTGKLVGCPKNFDFSQALSNDISGLSRGLPWGASLTRSSLRKGGQSDPPANADNIG